MRKPIIAGNWKMHKTIAEAVMAVKNFEPHYELLNSLDNQFRGELKHLMNSL